MPLDSLSDVEPWTDACGEVSRWVDAHFSELPFMPPQYLMFYFHDADIRAKEPDSRIHQEQQLRRLIRQLRGDEPLDTQRPWWRGW